ANKNSRHFTYRACYIVALIYWLGNLYWMAQVTAAGCITFCIYTAAFWPLLAFAFRFSFGKIPLFIAAPIFIVAAERLQGLFLSGFFWKFLAHSQYRETNLIQIADIFGAAGVTFLVAMTSGLAAEILLNRSKKLLSILNLMVQTIIVAAAITGSIMYGNYRIEQTPACITQGPMIGSVQTNFPQSVKDSELLKDSEFMLKDLFQKNKESAQAGAEIIAWPETLVQANLDKRVLKVSRQDAKYITYHNLIAEQAKKTAYLLVGASGGTTDINEKGEIYLDKKYNSAFLYTPQGLQYPNQYDKMHLVPFGEVIPFKKDTKLHEFFIKFTPYNYDYSLDAGSNYTIFEMTSTKRATPKKYRFSVIICYEDTIPALNRRFVVDQYGKKQIDWIFNISNDGWFVKFNEKETIPTIELPQHTVTCVFRAIENRISIIRSVNCGISGMVDTLGRFRDDYIAGNLPKKVMQRKAIAGWFNDIVPIDNRVTFFSKYGQWLDSYCVVFLLTIFCWAIINKINSRNVEKDAENEKCY
ncbi:MAG TPA: apolipoprotein N-acyltransferase, partial [Sedimentisphaerales bacterium]|nr:apolipoprotein N-acyltransferase [Sedimentisphaerales bacterium]